jgi:flagellin-like hook-associated protein FlgL
MFANKNFDRWGVTLNGRDVGDRHDIRILEVGASGITVNGSASGLYYGSNQFDYMRGFGPENFAELQDAADGAWDGAHIRTQSHAQEALDAIQDAINRKDVVRASLGAFQNRLENTITNLGIMAENLQASESRISDVDVGTEMTEFTRNNILAQAAVSMLSQANSLPQLALSLLG